jgi:hypothetical protein
MGLHSDAENQPARNTRAAESASLKTTAKQRLTTGAGARAAVAGANLQLGLRTLLATRKFDKDSLTRTAKQRKWKRQ